MALWLVMAVSSLCSVILLILSGRISQPLWQRPGGGGAGRPIWPAGGAVLCILRLFNDLYCSLPQYGASPTGNVHSGYLYGSEYLFELGIYFRKSGSARTGSSRAALATLIARVLEVVIVACHMARNRIFRVRWRLSCGQESGWPVNF